MAYNTPPHLIIQYIPLHERWSVDKGMRQKGVHVVTTVWCDIFQFLATCSVQPPLVQRPWGLVDDSNGHLQLFPHKFSKLLACLQREE